MSYAKQTFNNGYFIYYVNNRWVRTRLGNGVDIPEEKQPAAELLLALYDRYVPRCIDLILSGIVMIMHYIHFYTYEYVYICIYMIDMYRDVLILYFQVCAIVMIMHYFYMYIYVYMFLDFFYVL
jgi:hypothetical protein